MEDVFAQGMLPMAWLRRLLGSWVAQDQVTAVLGRIAREGWAQRKPGDGGIFFSMRSTPDSLLQS